MPDTSQQNHHQVLNGNDTSRRAAEACYQYRWPLALLAVTLVAVTLGKGVDRVANFSRGVAQLADTSNGSGSIKPLLFDPSMDAWFGPQDESVNTYYDIEKTFVAEDFVMVTFEEPDHEFGVFSRQSLAAISRLTERFLTIPGVRHVRSLTYNPWIRYGTISDENGDEKGLIISDLVEGDPMTLTNEEIVARMVAMLGAERTAQRIGKGRVRAVIGQDADFSNHIGEPLLVGTVLNETGTATVIQVQVLRPRVDPKKVLATFHDESSRRVAPNLSSIEQQRAALRGVEHFLRVEKGLAIPTPERAQLVTWIESLPNGQDTDALRLELNDPTKNFMKNAQQVLVRKYFEFDPAGSGYIDRSEPDNPVEAAEGFVPAQLSPYTYKLGGVPLFERNFEKVGLSDVKYVPLMFLTIATVQLLVFRNLLGVAVPLTVVFGSIIAMIGIAFATGDLLNNLTMMSPNMLTAVSIADAIHLVAAYMLLRSRYDDKKTLIVEAVRRNALPVFLTSVTTAVGFYALTVSSLKPVKMLGSVVASGTFSAWLLSMTLVPAMLSLVPHQQKTGDTHKSLFISFFSYKRSQRFVRAIVGLRGPILATSTLLLVIALYGLTRVEIDSDFRAMFPEDNPTISDFTWIEDRMGGIGDLEIVFVGVGSGEVEALTGEEESHLTALTLRQRGASAAPDDFEGLSGTESAQLESLAAKQEAWNTKRIGVSTEFLRSLEAFENRLRQEMAKPGSALSVVTDFLSPLDTLRKIHQVQNKNLASYYRVPGEADVPDDLRFDSLAYDQWTEQWFLTPAQSGSTLVAQYYLQYESAARPGESLWTQLSADRTKFRIQGRVRQASSMKHLQAFDRIEAIARTEFPELAASVNVARNSPQVSKAHSSLTLSGKTLLFARTSDLFARGFIESMTVALAVISLIIGLIFRSVRLALVSLIPNVLPIILPLSVFGILGIPLDGPAILVSSVALGVCVDDTIHFFAKFTRGRKAGLAANDALVHVFSEVGAAMTITTTVLIIGFATLLLSDFTPNFQMGALAGLMIGIAWIADFVVTTALLSFDRNPAAAEVDEPEPTLHATVA